MSCKSWAYRISVATSSMYKWAGQPYHRRHRPPASPRAATAAVAVGASPDSKLVYYYTGCDTVQRSGLDTSSRSNDRCSSVSAVLLACFLDVLPRGEGRHPGLPVGLVPFDRALLPPAFVARSLWPDV
eukprot:1277325-Prymnesium_polylepis.4